MTDGKKTNWTKRIELISRLFLGALFVVSGLNGFLHFMPMPPFPAAAGDLLAAFDRSGYLFPLIKGTEVVAGALVLAGLFVPLALTVLAPIVLNIVAFHVFLAPGTVGVLMVMVAAGTALAWAHRTAFAPLLRARPMESPVATPVPVSVTQARAA